MKTFQLASLCFASLFAGLGVQAKDDSSASKPVVVERGPSHNLWQYETQEPGPNGKTVTKIHQYRELASELNYLNSAGQWTASQEKIEAFSGGAVARQGQHKVIFANNLNTTGAIDMETYDGNHLRSQILCLMYVDSTTGQAVTIGQLQDSEGVLVGDNKVLYKNAFNGVAADVQYTYRRDGLEQDVVLREQPPTPEAYGLQSATAELEVVTEFDHPPTGVKNQPTSNLGGELDQSLSWGATSLGVGKAFNLNGQDTPARVYKRYTTISGRHFLLEKVRVQDVKPSLSKLPEQASNAKRLPGMASSHFMFPKIPVAKSVARPMRLAMGELPDKGYVLDYVAVSTAYTNYVFQGDSTYYVSGVLTLSGTNIFEGGTVIKYAANASITAANGSRFVFNSKPYEPVIFTAMDDDAVGQGISGSTGSPSGYYADPALNLASMGILTLSDFRIAYANRALSVSGASPAIYDAQLVNCATAVSDINSPIVLENMLLSNNKTNFNAATSVTNAIYVENATFNNQFDLISGNTNTWLYVTNSVFVNATNLAGNIAAGYNGFYQSPMKGASAVTNTYYPLQCTGAANCYLTNGCAFIDAGTTNVDAYLLRLLQARSVYAPVVFAGTTFSVGTSFSIQAWRDTNTPDLGYHYDALDYVFGASAVAYANLTFATGTAVGYYYDSSGGTYALALGDSVTASFQGTATAPCHWSKYSAVQEGNGNWTSQSYLGGIVGQSYFQAAPVIQMVFTKCNEFAEEGNFFRDNGALLVLRASDCEFYGGSIGGYSASYNLTNCLIANDQVGLWSNYGAANLCMENCTMIRGYLYGDNTSGGYWPVNIFNCAFDGTTFYLNAHGNTTNGYYTDYNSFLLNSNQTTYLGGHEVIVTNSYNWQSSWFGNDYLPLNSPLIQAGSTKADQVGLYHFTTQTNQVPETNSIVDIGYHYVATDTYGNPLDSNGDGIPDYIEDANGNGLADNGETNWALAILTQPASQIIMASGAASFNAVAVGNSAPAYQWYFNGTNLLAGATNSTLAILNAQTNNAGNYSVVVTNIYGPVTSSVAGLTIINWTTITPTNLAGGTANFAISISAASSCPGPFAYQWQHDGTNIGNLMWTVAGNYQLGANYSGDGGVATNACLSYPSGVALNSAGNLYIADSGNNVIRKVDTNGIITTVAGNYNRGGYGGDGGAATNAAINGPTGVAMDSAGNLYIADLGNNVIRKVDTNGIITTVAGKYRKLLGGTYSGDGSNATSAGLNHSSGVTMDSAGNLYIADSGNNVIRKVDTNGIITTVAGNHQLGANYSGDGGVATNACLNYPSGVFLDSAGNLYIADCENSVIRKVDTNGIITTVAGNHFLGGTYFGDGGSAPNAGLSGSAGVALDTVGDLYIADYTNNVIREVVAPSNMNIAGGTLTLSNVTTAAAGNYQVIVSGPCGSITTSATTLTVVVPVSITVQPINQSVIQGHNATFGVSATGTAPINYQWWWNGASLAGATNASLTVSNVQGANAGVYFVVASNIGGSQTSSSAVLTVVPVTRLAYWRFDNTNTWVGEAGQLPLLTNGLLAVPSWSTNGVQVDNTNGAELAYRSTETGGNANISCQEGTLRFWFKPDWAGTNTGGFGLSGSGRLIEMGNQAPTKGWWALALNPGGTQLTFGTQTNGLAMTNLVVPITWTSNFWHQIVLTYSPAGSTLYLDGVAATNGLGSIYYPNASEQANGFRIGSDSNGSNQAQGAFDELETFNYQLSAVSIATNYQALISQDSNSDGMSDIWEADYFGNIGVATNGDPDGDGLTTLQEWLMNSKGYNPVKWNSFTNSVVGDGYQNYSGDGLANLMQAAFGGNMLNNNPTWKANASGDGLPDEYKTMLGLSTNSAQSAPVLPVYSKNPIQ